jgi:hypothetical protein
MRVVAGSNGVAKSGTEQVESKGLARFEKVGAGNLAKFFVIGIALDWFGREQWSRDWEAVSSSLPFEI